jgi:hypothetical protein
LLTFAFERLGLLIERCHGSVDYFISEDAPLHLQRGDRFPDLMKFRHRDRLSAFAGVLRDIVHLAAGGGIIRLFWADLSFCVVATSDRQTEIEPRPLLLRRLCLDWHLYTRR